MKDTYRAFAVVFAVFVFLTPLIGFADEHEGRGVTEDGRAGSESEYRFEPIVPIPNVTTNRDITFEQYVNQLFRISISLGAILAVLMIIYGGFVYMTSEATGGKKEGLSKIQNALLGLLLLLAVVLILRIINPCIIEINALSGQSSACSPAEPLPESAEPESTARYAETATDPDCVSPSAICINPETEAETQPTNNACTAPYLLRYKCALDTGVTTLENGSLIGPRTALKCENMQNVCQNTTSGTWAQESNGRCPTGTVPRGICPNATPPPVTVPPTGTGSTLDANGVGSFPSPSGTGTIQSGVVGAITNCPVAVYKICYNSLTRDFTVPTYQAGRARCTAPAQLRDFCERP